MQSVSIANQILDHIVQESKNVLLDKKITKQKMPVFINKKMSDVNVDSMAHGGYQHQYMGKRKACSMQKQPQPKNLARDRWGNGKSKIDKKINKSAASSPSKQKSHRSYSFSGFGKPVKSTGFNSLKMQSNIKEKQNRFIKLDEDNKGKVVIERVKQRQSMEQDEWRQQKKKALMEQYQQKIANDIFDKQRKQSRETKRSKLLAHTKRGSDHKFYFHQGQAILYREDQSPLKKNYPKKTCYNIEADEFQEAEMQREREVNTKSSRVFKKTQQKTVNDNPTFNEHHKIKSARGQAFASAVLKTINLSRISLNETLRNLQVQQFMQRNDLFNNNHSRQTSSIPYLLPKSGTVYTELSTNQVVGEGKVQSQSRQSYTFRSETTKIPKSARKKSHFQPYHGSEHENNNKTEHIFEKRNIFEEDEVRVERRPIRTADNGRKRAYFSERRPQTSTTKGRITTANQDLAMALLK